MVSTLLLKDISDRTAFKVFEPGVGAALPGFGSANNVRAAARPGQLARPAVGAGDRLAARRGVLRRRHAGADRHAARAAGGAGASRRRRLRAALRARGRVPRLPHRRARRRPLARSGARRLAGRAARRCTMLHPGYQLLAEGWADLADEALAIVRRTAQALGLPLRSLEIELGPSQFEAVFAPTDALTAADQMVLFRNHVRQALRRAGYHASFVCRPPFAERDGQRLAPAPVAGRSRSGANAFAARAGRGSSDVDATHTLSDVGAHWLAGLLAHAPGMAAVVRADDPRLQPLPASVMAPQAAVWGRDNRGAMLRVLGRCRRRRRRGSRTASASRWPTPTSDRGAGPRRPRRPAAPAAAPPATERALRRRRRGRCRRRWAPRSTRSPPTPCCSGARRRRSSTGLRPSSATNSRATSRPTTRPPGSAANTSAASEARCAAMPTITVHLHDADGTRAHAAARAGRSLMRPRSTPASTASRPTAAACLNCATCHVYRRRRVGGAAAAAVARRRGDARDDGGAARSRRAGCRARSCSTTLDGLVATLPQRNTECCGRATRSAPVARSNSRQHESARPTRRTRDATSGGTP